jgi:hypothetical protein
MLKRKRKKKEKKLPLLGFEPTPLSFNTLTVILAYLNTLQSGEKRVLSPKSS